MEDKGTSTDDMKEDIKEVKETIDDMIDKIEKEAKETKETKEAKETKETETSTDNEINIMNALNDGYKPTGKVSRKTYIFEMEQAEDKLKHIIDELLILYIYLKYFIYHGGPFIFLNLIIFH